MISNGENSSDQLSSCNEIHETIKTGNSCGFLMDGFSDMSHEVTNEQGANITP